MNVFRRIAAAVATITAALTCVVALAAAPAAANPSRLHAAPPVVGPSSSATPPGWAIQKTRNPARKTTSTLSEVSCTSARVCTAVGFSENSAGVTSTLAERWNGTKWAIQKTPNPAGGGQLLGVSCRSARVCAAVGFSTTHGVVGETLAERWNGTKWAIQKTPNPAAVSELNRVSCTSARVCTAVGDYTSSAGTTATLAERWNGTKWAIQKTPTPAGATSSELNGVSCTSARVCTAVGFSENSAGLEVTLAERHS